MTDFFDDLERQLVTAAQHRPQRLRRARARHAATLATVLLAVLAGGAGLATALTHGGDGTTGVGAPAATTATARTERTTAAAPTAQSQSRSFTVAILNGTAVPGLARGVANRLQNTHFKIGNVTNASRQDHATTTVHFAPGRQVAATRVAAAIDLKDFVLQPITRAERVIAGEQASVVVVVGSDQNTSPAP
jgi:hypothetical protein